jgi:putative peptide zinc metalloprotease protein
MAITSSSPEAVPQASGDAGVPSAAAGQAAVPCRAEGLELIGELPGSGYRVPPSLVRRSDGQTIQLTRLLYLVLEAVDGRRDHEDIAEVVSTSTGRGVSGEQVATLIESKLLPLGLLRLADGREPEVKKANPLLALRFRYVVSDPAKTRRLTAPFATLFAPVVVTVLTLAFLASAGWVLFEKGLAAATHQAFEKPGLLLALFAVTLVSAGFHEFGHAAACRYGGATPGAMGTGLYLVWPAFYTEVTDSYRLGRGGRVRVDLGGLYFNAIFAVGSFAVWAVTRWDAVLLLIAAQVLQMLRQLAPFVRFDGYHILADLTGVPDLYHHIKPTMVGLLPWHWDSSKEQPLKRWARAIVTVWVLVVVPLLLFSLLMMVVALPRVLATGWESLGKQWHLLENVWSQGDLAGVGVRALSIVAIGLPLLATIYLVVRVVRRTTTSAWRSTSGKPAKRAVAGVVAAALVAGLALAWWPREGTYRPIQATERGTLFDAVPVAQRVAGVGGDVRQTRAGVAVREGDVANTRTVLPDGTKLGDKDHPQLALVLVPEPGSDEPTWVFPFNKPAPPGAGGNQALAVNTEDGSTVYDVTFALVWADGDTVLNRNEAYAFASCTSCTTVAVAFQVVFIVGQAHVIAPQNLSAAANYNCVACITYALAKQLIISLPGGLSAAAMARLDAVWAQLQELSQQIRSLSLDQIQARLTTIEQAIREVVAADQAHQATSSPSPDAASAAPSDQASSDSSAGPGGSSSDGPSADATTPTPEPSDSPASTPSDTAEPEATPTGAATDAPTPSAAG